MRENKFRAWDGKKYLYLDKADFEIAYCGVQVYAEFGGSRTIECELEQFTGLRDKNGMEIYEGDIVLLSGTRFEVVFNKKIAIFCMMRTSPCKAIRFFGEDTTDMVSVIGNIHESPELLP